jgi:hypothetical protein
MTTVVYFTTLLNGNINIANKPVEYGTTSDFWERE